MCGRANAYRFGWNYAFNDYYSTDENFRVTIDGPYVDGLSLTHEITVSENETCFEISRPDNDLLEGFQAVSLVLYRPDREGYKLCQSSLSLPIGLEDDDGIPLNKIEAQIVLQMSVDATNNVATCLKK